MSTNEGRSSPRRINRVRVHGGAAAAVVALVSVVIATAAATDVFNAGADGGARRQPTTDAPPQPSPPSQPAALSSPPRHSRGNREGYLFRRRRRGEMGDGRRSVSTAAADGGAGRRGRVDRAGNFDDPEGCGLYVAESSIPNSGLGMYSSRPHRKGDALASSSPEVGISLCDAVAHSAATKTGLLNQYPWSAHVLTHSQFECGSPESMVPGIGMLANSHLGLVNVGYSDHWKTDFEGATGTDLPPSSSLDGHDGVGSLGPNGGSSPHGNVRFEVGRDVVAGEELFVSYGDQWFAGRENLLGAVPGKEHFDEADRLLREFLGGTDGKNEPAGRGYQYKRLLEHAKLRDDGSRLLAALPADVSSVSQAVEVGTARFLASDSIRSAEWLDEYGACIDNIRGGASTIPRAGRGAFATRFLRRGDTIATTPVVTLGREQLNIYEETEINSEGGGGSGKQRILVGHQILLNYCYGQSNSSLVFFPYAPSVNFINHGISAGDEPTANAKIRWSAFPYHRKEWLNSTIDEMKRRLKTGLMFDVVATRDVRRGEEILINYGAAWEERWGEHLRRRAETDAELRIGGVSAGGRAASAVRDLNADAGSIVRTESEQVRRPYPPDVATTCFFENPERCDPTSPSGECSTRWSLTLNSENLRPCAILSRNFDIGGNHWYTVEVTDWDSMPEQFKLSDNYQMYTVRYIPRYAIRFVHRPYSRVQHDRQSFRHVIGLPEDILPSHWIDLR